MTEFPLLYVRYGSAWLYLMNIDIPGIESYRHSVTGVQFEIHAIPNISTGWAESGWRAALPRSTWRYWWMRSST